MIARVSEGEPLAQVCRDMGIGLTTWYDWEKAHPEVYEAIARARLAGEEMIAADALRIADTPMEGKRVKVSEDGTETVTEDMLGHRKLQIETRLKLLAKWNPRKWGDKVELAGSKDAPLTVKVVEVTSQAERDAAWKPPQK